jgi:hypothetical protein
MARQEEKAPVSVSFTQKRHLPYLVIIKMSNFIESWTKQCLKLPRAATWRSGHRIRLWNRAAGFESL